MSMGLTLMGEHDVFLEFAVPMIMYVLVPQRLRMEMPVCDFSPKTLGLEYDPSKPMYKPLFQPTQPESIHLKHCPTFHPIKFGKIESIQYLQTMIWNELCVGVGGPLASTTTYSNNNSSTATTATMTAICNNLKKEDIDGLTATTTMANNKEYDTSTFSFRDRKNEPFWELVTQ